jgi:hypothetical protein
MSQFEVSEELARQVEAKTGKSDLEDGVWQLLYQGRGRHVQEEASEDGHPSRLSD